MNQEVGKKGDTTQDMIWVGQERKPPAAPPAAPSPVQAGRIEELNSRRDEQSRALAETLVTSFTDRLMAEAAKKNGYLTIGDLTELAAEFKAKTAELEKVFAQSFKQYERARERARELASFDHARQYPFDRIIVDSFAELFEPRYVRSDGADAVTRRLLPGFFMALDRMLSQDVAEELQQRARRIVDRVFPGDEKDLNWEVIYADGEARDLLLDALMAIAPHFHNIKRRQEWFLPLVNGSLDATDDWRLTERGFYNLVDFMFARLRTAFTTYEARQALVARHGEAACLEVERAFLHMDQARPGYG